MNRVQELELALDAAINLLSVYEHGDSRRTSDEFGALACVACNITNSSCVEILTRARDMDLSEAAKKHQEMVYSQVVVTYEPAPTVYRTTSG